MLKFLILFCVLFGISYLISLYYKKKLKRFLQAINGQKYEYVKDVRITTFSYGLASVSKEWSHTDVVLIDCHVVLIMRSYMLGIKLNESIIQLTKNRKTGIFHGVSRLRFIDAGKIEGSSLLLVTIGPNINSGVANFELDFSKKGIDLGQLLTRINTN